MRIIPIYVGIDLSYSSTGLVILDTKGELFHSEILSSKKVSGLGKNSKADFDRAIGLAEHISEVIQTNFEKFDNYTGIIIGLEQYAYTPRAGHTYSIGELGGLVKYFLNENFTFPIPIAATQIKKYATNNGRAQKADVMMGIKDRWGVELRKEGSKNLSDDLSDAYVIARILYGSRNRDGLPKFQLEIIEKIFGGDSEDTDNK